jgi:hypothetical protein
LTIQTKYNLGDRFKDCDIILEITGIIIYTNEIIYEMEIIKHNTTTIIGDKKKMAECRVDMMEFIK